MGGINRAVDYHEVRKGSHAYRTCVAISGWSLDVRVLLGGGRTGREGALGRVEGLDKGPATEKTLTGAQQSA